MVKIKNVLITTICLIASLSPIFAQDKIEATVLKDEMTLWTLLEDGKMEDSKKELNAGTTVSVYLKTQGGNQVPETITGEITLSWRKTSTQDFTKISYDGNDYYAISSMICAGGTPGVITTENACLYRTKSLADVTPRVLIRSKVVCIKGTFPTVGGKEMSYITYYDEGLSGQKSGYVKTEKISLNRDDITALRVLNKINASSNQQLRTDLVSTLRDLNVSGNVLELIGEAEMRTLRATDLSLAGVMDIYPQKFTYDVEDDYVNIRDIPSKSGKSIGKLEYEGEFIAIRRTLATQTFDRVTDCWYYGVSKGVDGWIFGGYLTPIEEEVEEDELLDEEGEATESSGESSDSSSTTTSEPSPAPAAPASTPTPSE